MVSGKQPLRAKVSRVLTFSCVDGPGNRLVIFMQGCNFNCLSCHNPHTIRHCHHCGDCVPTCPSQALRLNADQQVEWLADKCTHCDRCIEHCVHQSNPKIHHYSVEQLVELIRRNHYFLAGITISGGEATLQLPFIIALFKAIKHDEELKHLSCFIDSNGSLSESGWDKISSYLDGAMIDLKAWQEETHRWLTGRSNHRVIRTIFHLATLNKLHEVRLLHIPDKSDLETEITEVAHLINQLPANVSIRLNAFQHHGVVGKALTWQPCSEGAMLQFHRKLAAQVQRTVYLPTRYA
ncbi:YjjW family glycine radical enzyme activase [Vibrio anguillarum]|uniref:YjjW family glycine radical enzyme activase n=1 Tax=Vibrio anguillarum TaxID=55601 RepID=UPI00097E1AA9|nr:YjjW family glycine radical enzyme activase [Vibrio anguillarum]AQM21230.1 glycine radical enzyme activase [Vibrio anguillarum]AUB86596.1 YjjW family glycine radical enzyme activase [Vibrio anguillarum]AUB90036.1 YjjW family glycine radical enzyme activase [Vibrio anguillarum]AUB93476.1 YjjW family glycine radical enzyme activase [Vibrio anguillarum]AUB96897.1 YjjW family glycine radical enzyme activase [Vibrio anguillarum]